MDIDDACSGDELYNLKENNPSVRRSSWPERLDGVCTVTRVMTSFPAPDDDPNTIACEMLEARVEGVLVGIIEMENSGEWAQITELLVARDCRKAGVASLLMSEFCRIVDAKRQRSCVLAGSDDCTPVELVDFYARYHFTRELPPVATQTEFVQRAIRMEGPFYCMFRERTTHRE